VVEIELKPYLPYENKALGIPDTRFDYINKKIVINLAEVWEIAKTTKRDFVEVFCMILNHEMIHYFITTQVPKKYVHMLFEQERIADLVSGTLSLKMEYNVNKIKECIMYERRKNLMFLMQIASIIIFGWAVLLLLFLIGGW